MARVDRASLSVLLALALLGGGLSFILGGQPQARADTVPDGLFADLTFLNKKLGNLIRDERKGDGLEYPDLVPRVTEIQKAKQEMVDEFFATEIYGVKFSEIFKQLDCIDSKLSLGRGQAWPGSRQSNEKIADFFAMAKKCKEKLEEKLRKVILEGGDGAPQGLFAELTFLNKKLGNLIQDERKGDGLDYPDLVPRVTEIQKAKQEMVDEFFTTEIYGVKFSEIFKQLDCIDSKLSLGRGQAWPGSRQSNEKIADFFAMAKKCKEKLEEKLHAANASPSPSPSTSPTATGSLSPSASASPSWTLGFSGTWYHFGPGESGLYGCVTTSPAQGGAPYNYSLTKPDNSTTSKSGNLGTDGKAAISSPINQYGTYKQTVSVISNGVTQEKTTETNVTSSQGQNGCP